MNNATESYSSDASLSDQDTACTSSTVLQPPKDPPSSSKNFKLTRLKKRQQTVRETERENSGEEEMSFNDDRDTSSEELDNDVEILTELRVCPKMKSLVTKAGPSQPKRATPSPRKITNGKRKSLQPPSGFKVEMVKATTAELVWSLPSNRANHIAFVFRVRYWREGQHGSFAIQQDVASTETGCLLENLVPDTNYLTSILIISADGHDWSISSNICEFTTLDKDIRTVEAIRNRSKKIGSHRGLDLYAVPLTKNSKSRAKIDHFVFGNARHSRLCEKTIMLMGVTGSGKTTLINAMINYIFKVRRYDQFRFQLVQKRPTNRIVVYDIHHDEDFNIPFSLTIIDTPSFVEDTEKNEAIVEMIRELFQGPRNIFDLNLFGLVAQASFPRLVDSQIQIMDSVSDIFGGDAKDHTNFLLTVSDEQVPPILKFLSKIGHPRPTKTVSGDSYAYNKFNSAGFFGEFSDRVAADNYPFWDMCVKNFESFFNLLGTMEPIKIEDS